MKSAFKYQCKFLDMRAFTLLEVMLSVSIIALIVVSLFRMQSGSITLATANSFNRVAPVLAGQIMAQISRDPGEWTETEGDFGERFPGISWQCEVSEAEFKEIEFITAENMPRLKKISLKVKDQSGGRPFEITGWRLADE